MVFEYIYPNVDSSQNSIYKKPSSSLYSSYNVHKGHDIGNNLL